jgi:hypothetical protein
MNKYINPVNTRRISVNMEELEMDQIQALCEIPAVHEQRTISKLLSFICKPIDRPGAVADPRHWSVNERMHVVASYMSGTRDDGPNFPLHEKGDTRQTFYADYILEQTDYVADIPFQFGGESLIFSPMLGYQAEAIETLIDDGVYQATDYSWWCASMAACVRGVDDEPLVYIDDASYAAALVERITPIRRMKDRKFCAFFDAYMDATMTAAHLMHVVTSQYGLVAAKVSETPGEEVPEVVTARFPAHSCISERARQIMGFV